MTLVVCFITPVTEHFIGGGLIYNVQCVRAVRDFLLSLIKTAEKIMGTNGLLDSSTKVPKNQSKTVNSLMKNASMTVK